MGPGDPPCGISGVTGSNGCTDSGHHVIPPKEAPHQDYFYYAAQSEFRPIVIRPEDFKPKPLMARYSKEKLREGAKFYAKLSMVVG
jgi:hypothetical protein